MAELGHFSLILGLFLAGYAVFVDLLGSWRKDAGLVNSGRNATISSWICITVAMSLLWVLLIRHDFSIKYVAEHTCKLLPLLYKISALWAGASGSLLLWLWLQVGFVLLVFSGTSLKQRSFTATARIVANFVSVFFLIILIFDKSPFALSSPVPADGMGLNPLLQHPAMAIHPPTLFVGYAGFMIAFAWAFADLKVKKDRRVSVLFAQSRNWTLISWLFLTVGIVLGAWWAYEELGWGGYWAWDPVENSSLMPWLTATALLHCFRRYKPASTTARWLTVLGLLTFSLCIFGTFLTRYGLVSSVHAFPEPGLGILFVVLLAIIWLVAGVLIWFAWRREPLDDSEVGIVGRRFISYNNWLMVLLTMVVFVGTLFPFFSGLLTDEKVSLQEGGYFTKTAAPFGLGFLLLIGICPELVRHGIKSSWRVIGAVLFALAGIAGWVITRSLAIPCFVFCVFSAINLTVDFITGLGARTGGKSLRWYGTRMAHVGVVLVFFGIAGSGAYDVEEQAALRKGQSVTVGKYRVQFDQLRADHSGANFIAVFADVSVYMGTDSNEPNSPALFRLSPARAFYKNEKKTSEVDIHRSLAGDFYVALADVDKMSELINLRVLIKPLINWIWIGSTISVVGASLVIFSFYRRKTAV